MLASMSQLCSGKKRRACDGNRLHRDNTGRKRRCIARDGFPILQHVSAGTQFPKSRMESSKTDRAFDRPTIQQLESKDDTLTGYDRDFMSWYISDDESNCGNRSQRHASDVAPRVNDRRRSSTKSRSPSDSRSLPHAHNIAIGYTSTTGTLSECENTGALFHPRASSALTMSPPDTACTSPPNVVAGPFQLNFQCPTVALREGRPPTESRRTRSIVAEVLDALSNALYVVLEQDELEQEPALVSSEGMQYSAFTQHVHVPCAGPIPCRRFAIAELGRKYHAQDINTTKQLLCADRPRGDASTLGQSETHRTDCNYGVTKTDMNAGDPDLALTDAIRFIMLALKTRFQSRMQLQAYMRARQLAFVNALQGQCHPIIVQKAPMMEHLDFSNTAEGRAFDCCVRIINSGALRVNTIMSTEQLKSVKKLYDHMDVLINGESATPLVWHYTSYSAQILAHRACTSAAESCESVSRGTEDRFSIPECPRGTQLAGFDGGRPWRADGTQPVWRSNDAFELRTMSPMSQFAGGEGVISSKPHITGFDADSKMLLHSAQIRDCSKSAPGSRPTLQPKLSKEHDTTENVCFRDAARSPEDVIILSPSPPRPAAIAGRILRKRRRPSVYDQ